MIGRNYLRGIGGGRKDLGEQRIGIESDGGNELFELLRSESLVRRLVETPKR